MQAVMSSRIAYLAGGQLYLKLDDAPALKFESPFGQTLQEQKEQTHRQRAWKRKGMFAGMMPPEMAERMANQEPPPLPIQITSVCTGGDGLFYSLSTGSIGGFLTVDPERKSERRLFHTADFQLEHIAHESSLGLVACTLVHANGSRHIGVMRENGARPDEVTEGDGIDLAPTWVPGAGKTVVFQSAGVARDASGYIRDRAPFTIEKLDIEHGELTTLAEEKGTDFLAPRMTADGTLYCIRRPHKSKEKVSFWRVMLAIVGMPFMFLHAIFQWCNFFSWRYTGKELTRSLGTAGAAGGKGQDEEKQPDHMQAWGELISPQAMPKGRNRSLGEEPVAWVPNNWELVRRKPGEEWETLANAVLAYDIAADGSVYFTNGGAIFRRSSEGKTEKVLQHGALSGFAVF
jgi:hypothetical protein